MLFNSHEFILVFLPIVLMGFFALNQYVRLRLAWLVAASLAFYGWWDPIYLWLITGSICANYVIGKYLRKGSSKPLLIFGVTLNLGLLAIFKYLDFGIEIWNNLFSQSFAALNIILPLAISFFTFQQIAYLADSYEKLTVPHSFGDYALFVSFFPQLIAGPIVHQSEILPQFRRKAGEFDAQLFYQGLTLFTLGLIKKVWIADNIAPFSTTVFDAALSPDVQISFFEAWSGALAYTFQIYFDFSGYTDMALGAAMLFGIRLPINFDSPYKALSIIDFWRRWHMTLSRFLRDYLYIPLGGSRRGELFTIRNLVIVMVLGGLWHGAAWTFVIWGSLHGVYLLMNHLWINAFPAGISGPTWKAFSWILTFIAVVTAWVFFRAETLPAAWAILEGMAGLNGIVLGYNHQIYLGPLADMASNLGVEFVPQTLFSVWSVLWITLSMATSLFLPNSQEWILREHRPLSLNALRWQPSLQQAAAIGILAALVVSSFSAASEFLYFNF
jgi:D-alanyl-lipoteichoic acid acyltransferase DltB (MBOAT superfamily)